MFIRINVKYIKYIELKFPVVKGMAAVQCTEHWSVNVINHMTIHLHKQTKHLFTKLASSVFANQYSILHMRSSLTLGMYLVL